MNFENRTYGKDRFSYNLSPRVNFNVTLQILDLTPRVCSFFLCLQYKVICYSWSNRTVYEMIFLHFYDTRKHTYIIPWIFSTKKTFWITTLLVSNEKCLFVKDIIFSPTLKHEHDSKLSLRIIQPSNKSTTENLNHQTIPPNPLEKSGNT